MDFFSREPGPSYVPAFGARVVLAMGQGSTRAGGEIQRAIRAEGLDDLWALAMVVVQWYADALPPAESSAVTSVLQAFALAPVASNLNLFRERLLPFVREAYQAQGEAQLAAAGVYFVAAVEQIGLGTLSSAIKSGPVADLRRKLSASLPPPPGLQAAYERVLAGQAGAPTIEPAVPAVRSRSDRFDRADFAPRERERSQPGPRPEVQARVVRHAAPLARTPPQLPVPDLADAEVARAYLHTLGWSGSEVDRLLEGPDSKRRA